MATKPDKTRHGLSVAQLNAVECLVSGMTDGEAAEAVGVTRQTVNVWRNHHPAFIAGLNRRRLEVWGAATDKLRALVPKALGVLDASLTTDPDPRVALRIVQLAGLDRHGRGAPNLGPASIGPTDPEAVLEAEAVRRRGEDDFLQMMMAGGPMTEEERRALLAELEGELAALGAGGEQA